MLKFERFIAGKHLTHRRKTGFISLISWISIGGVAVGVMALIIVLAVMSGFDRELKAKIVNVQPHLRIEKFGGVDHPQEDLEKIRAHHIPGLIAVATYIEGQAILRSQDGTNGVLVKGLDAVNEDLSIYRDHLVAGELEFDDYVSTQTRRRFFFFKKTVETRTGSLFIGESLAAALRVQVGDTVAVIAPSQDSKKTLSLAGAETRNFKVRGIFRLGMNDFDAHLILLSLPQTQSLYHLGPKVSGISLRFQDVDQAENWKFRLREDFGLDYSIYSWYDMNRTFFRALKTEKFMMTILLALIILVAAFNIVSTLMMIVMEKTKDIGIMRAIGATQASIRTIFVIEGFSIGLWGIVSGTTLGLLGAFNLNAIMDFVKKTTGWDVFPSDIYYFDKIPAEVHGDDVVVIVAFALLASIFAALYPAHRGAQLNPVEALRYE